MKKGSDIDKKLKIMSILIGQLDIRVQLNSSKTATDLQSLLPISSSVNRWGNEIYFSIPLNEDIENGVEEVEIGTVAFWPPGNSLCIFFGKTPVSTGEKPRAASAVTVIGNIMNIEGLITELKEIRDGEIVTCKLI